LNVISFKQLASHCSYQGYQQLTDLQRPSIQCGSADAQTRFTLQGRTLPMQRKVIAVFADNRVDDDAVSGQALLNNPRR
jgi:hypothetical protein